MAQHHPSCALRFALQSDSCPAWDALTLISNVFHFPVRALLALGLCTLLAACGGGDTGFPPVVTGFQAQTLQYGRTATLLVGGNDLRKSMTADMGEACTSPSFGASSTTSLMVINCKVVQLGDMTLTLKDAAGQVVYQTTLNVPKPQVQLKTSSGNITLELDPVAAPLSVNNFLGYVNSGFYAKTLFHRVIAGFMAQGGGFTTGMVQKTGLKDPIALESQNGLKHLRGTVAMARTDVPNSATSQFFINLVDNAFLNYQSANSPGYAVFGTVVSGMEVVDSMATQSTTTVNGYANVPVSDITINSASQIR